MMKKMKRRKNRMRLSKRVYTLEEIRRSRDDFHDVTPNGVVFDWGLAGPQGAWFTLIKQGKQTLDDLQVAAKYLRANRDVIRLDYALAEEVDEDGGHDGHELAGHK
jgi:hypothetical protein